jgi:hypothetical protein
MKHVLSMVGALIAGFIGGVVGTRMQPPAQQSPQKLIRAQKFELVDGLDQPISFWGIDEKNNAVLAFGRRGLALDRVRHSSIPGGLEIPENQLASFGLLANDSPQVMMRGGDGKTRVRLYLSDYAQPLLAMEDESGPRVWLGVQASDTPGPDDNEWTLAFHPERARIGMTTQTTGGKAYVNGYFFVNKEKIRYPSGGAKGDR